MTNKILSVGIDIGTTTTQIIFSEIVVQNTAGSFLVPKVKITKKSIVYKSKIYFTPLISSQKINLDKLENIILCEYKKAGIDKKNISTGAIIMTGESTRKDNSEKVLNILSDFAGDFVVATAGPDLESILAGYGSGAYEISKNTAEKIINFDVGGGTTNAVVFSGGEPLDSFALDIGGRLIRFDNEGKIIYISEKINKLIENLKLNLSVGKKPVFNDLKILTDNFANIICKISNNVNLNAEERKLFIEHENKKTTIKLFMFSGGVSEFVYGNDSISTLSDTTKFGDIGPLLGCSIRNTFKEKGYIFIEPREKIRATVIGAGSHSIKLSGSTIIFEDDILPIKNIPIIRIFNNKDEDENENIDNIYKNICKKSTFYKNQNIAIAFKGPKSPKYVQIKKMANAIVEAFKDRSNPIIIVIENDFAKALGQTIKNIVKNSKAVICIDNIRVDTGDYIDIGKSISNTVPVVIKTLIFKN
ncbi:ethanolamine ammonia-lyase reactivating factor EutA [Clostridium tyrobutyricum]|uniref:ethanolamine ammonia-lyase reactivating factor EutA n=1 Tax=Clostridium tyrobutyricum TaxID=1519 RepID=UPI00057C9CFF|nr:ethanolamine ammonia-lyase reactivating factor EutA [Clostridium tyrobutyricum]